MYTCRGQQYTHLYLPALLLSHEVRAYNFWLDWQTISPSYPVLTHHLSVLRLRTGCMLEPQPACSLSSGSDCWSLLLCSKISQLLSHLCSSWILPSAGKEVSLLKWDNEWDALQILPFLFFINRRQDPESERILHSDGCSRFFWKVPHWPSFTELVFWDIFIQSSLTR